MFLITGGCPFRDSADPDRFDRRSFGRDGLGLHRPAPGHPEGEDANVSSSLSEPKDLLQVSCFLSSLSEPKNFLQGSCNNKNSFDF